MLMDLATLRFGGVELGTESKLPRTVVLRDVPDALADEIPAEANLPSFRSDTSQCNTNMRVLGAGSGLRRPIPVVSPESASISDIRLRGNRFKSTRSPNSGETINFPRASRRSLSANPLSAGRCRSILQVHLNPTTFVR